MFTKDQDNDDRSIFSGKTLNSRRSAAPLMKARKPLEDIQARLVHYKKLEKDKKGVNDILLKVRTDSKINDIQFKNLCEYL